MLRWTSQSTCFVDVDGLTAAPSPLPNRRLGTTGPFFAPFTRHFEGPKSRQIGERGETGRDQLLRLKLLTLTPATIHNVLDAACSPDRLATLTSSMTTAICDAATAIWLKSVTWLGGPEFDRLVWDRPTLHREQPEDVRLFMVVDVVKQDWHPDMVQLWTRQPILANCARACDIHLSVTAVAPAEPSLHRSFDDALTNLKTVGIMAGRQGRQLRGLDSSTIRFHHTPIAVSNCPLRGDDR